MTFKPGFDKHYAGSYRLVIAAFAVASAIMMAASASGKTLDTSPGMAHAIVLSALSLAVCLWCCRAVPKARFSFRCMAIAGVAFSVAMWGYGMPLKSVLFVGLTNLIGLLVSLLLGEKADLIDVRGD